MTRKPGHDCFLIIVYTAFVLVLFKFMHIKPTAYIVASIILAGVFMIGGVAIVWTQAAPIIATVQGVGG